MSDLEESDDDMEGGLDDGVDYDDEFFSDEDEEDDDDEDDDGDDIGDDSDDEEPAKPGEFRLPPANWRNKSAGSVKSLAVMHALHNYHSRLNFLPFCPLADPPPPFCSLSHYAMPINHVNPPTHPPFGNAEPPSAKKTKRKPEPKKRPARPRRHMEIEYEEEMEAAGKGMA